MEERKIMPNTTPEALLVGHLCLDMIPKFPTGGSSVAEFFVPGKLIDIDGMFLSNGGSANNTGQAMHRLGFAVRIVGKLGDDMIGRAILDNMRHMGEQVISEIIVSPGEDSSFTVILNPPGIDRIFLHSAAANATFVADDMPDSAFDSVKLMHYGYPPLMASFFANDGAEAKKLFQRARAKGITVSLDMARPDPNAPSGRIDWVKYLENVLPEVDLFLPSIDEMLFMLDRPLFDKLLAKGGNMASYLDMAVIGKIADRLIAMGPALVGFKLGDEGFYLKTTSEAERFARMGALSLADPQPWLGREMAAPCFSVEVVGTTGSGDSTIAGFLGAWLKGLGPEEAVIMAVGSGGESVEALDAASGVHPWDSIVKRIAAGWPQGKAGIIPPGWCKTAQGVRVCS